jgi:hypothetical protein
MVDILLIAQNKKSKLVSFNFSWDARATSVNENFGIYCNTARTNIVTSAWNPGITFGWPYTYLMKMRVIPSKYLKLLFHIFHSSEYASNTLVTK